MCFTFIYFIIMLSSVTVVRSNTDVNGEYLYQMFNELPCLSAGGICVKADDCPEEKRAEYKGMCPVQQRSGVECCHALPTPETRCRYRGGECMSNATPCPENLTLDRASDCELDEKCCVLVNK